MKLVKLLFMFAIIVLSAGSYALMFVEGADSSVVSTGAFVSVPLPVMALVLGFALLLLGNAKKGAQ